MSDVPQSRPWLNRALYPFESHYVETPSGRMHYVDEGVGPSVVFVHGTPTWSFLWRGLIHRLAPSHRVVAPDHLGFGLSDKPEDAPYNPRDHARRLTALIEELGLRNVVLVVHDFGGPIGLSYAIDHPHNVRAVVLFNTWMYSKADDPSIRRAAKLLGGRFGRFLYRRLNVSPRILLPAMFGDRSKLTAEIKRHYVGPFPAVASRMGPWVFARELVGSSLWYDMLWNYRGVLAEKPALLLWGEQDAAFGLEDLDRMKSVFSRPEVQTFPAAGHFVQEEEPAAAAAMVARFLQKVNEAEASAAA